MSWYSFHTWKLDFQSNKDSHWSTSRYMYALSGFCYFYSNKESLLTYGFVPLAISFKILLCDNNGTMAWSKE